MPLKTTCSPLKKERQPVHQLQSKCILKVFLLVHHLNSSDKSVTYQTNVIDLFSLNQFLSKPLEIIFLFSCRPLTIPSITLPPSATDAFSAGKFTTKFEGSDSVDSSQKGDLLEEEEKYLEAFKVRTSHFKTAANSILL